MASSLRDCLSGSAGDALGRPVAPPRPWWASVRSALGGTFSSQSGGKFSNAAATVAAAKTSGAASQRLGGGTRQVVFTEGWHYIVLVEELDEVRGFLADHLRSLGTRYLLDLDEAKRIAQQERDKRGSHNDIGDAMRHAEWSRRMYEEINPITATVVGYGYEIEGFLFEGQPVEEMLMDLHNNAVGRDAASKGINVDRSKLISLDPSDSLWEGIESY
ncbi:MAG: hypothetical protein F4229_07540 [Gammaproteobacteria bacterium]|nr:hypothetical protein [Gammaproteobacteria bacterium]